MILIDDAALIDQRQSLRRRMLAQRQLIAYQIEPVPRAQRDSPVDTERRGRWRPALYAGVISGIASFVIGARYVGAIMAALAVVRMVRSTTRDPSVAPRPTPSASPPSASPAPRAGP